MISMFRAQAIPELKFSMNVLSTQNNVISRNVANVDTPFYKSLKLDYTEAMGNYYDGSHAPKPLTQTSSTHMAPPNMEGTFGGALRHQNNPSLRNDGNDVNVENEMTELAQSSVRFQVMSQVTGSEFGRLKSSITGQ